MRSQGRFATFGGSTGANYIDRSSSVQAVHIEDPDFFGQRFKDGVHAAVQPQGQVFVGSMEKDAANRVLAGDAVDAE